MMKHLAADQVLAPPHPDPVSLAPEGCTKDWRDCLDAGADAATTSSHPAEGWRAVDAGAAKP